MPVQARPDDQFTRDNLLLGFSTIEFEPALSTGGFDAPVELGILQSEALQKEVEIISLERGDSGTLTVDREIVSKLKPSFNIETFNMRADVARFVFGSDVVTAVVADAAAVVTGDQVTAPLGADATRTFLSLANADTALASYTATGSAITAETVTNVAGDGTVSGDFKLQAKVGAFGDVTLLEEISATGAIVRTFVPQAGVPASEFEAAVLSGTATTSGDLEFFQAVGAGNSIRATYNPTLAGVLDDNTAAVADFMPDELLGRVLFRRLDTFAAADANSAFRQGQAVDLNYTYSRKASNTLQPFRQNSFDGRGTIRHLPDVGVNFIWTIPSITIRLTDDDLSFGAEDFAVATLILNINDAGGTNRFGTLALSTEPEAAA